MGRTTSVNVSASNAAVGKKSVIQDGRIPRRTGSRVSDPGWLVR
jgi:hypothetical protein